MKDRIKKIRKELDLTQQKFADKLGVKRNTIAKYETGENTPSDAVISLICTKFNINEKWLRGGTGEMLIQQSLDEQIATFIGHIQCKPDETFIKRFISMLANLNESDWEVLEKMAIELVKKKD